MCATTSWVVSLNIKSPVIICLTSVIICFANGIICLNTSRRDDKDKINIHAFYSLNRLIISGIETNLLKRNVSLSVHYHHNYQPGIYKWLLFYRLIKFWYSWFCILILIYCNNLFQRSLQAKTAPGLVSVKSNLFLCFLLPLT